MSAEVGGVLRQARGEDRDRELSVRSAHETTSLASPDQSPSEAALKRA